MKQSSFFRRPWLFTDEQTQTLIRVSKKEFFEIVKTSAGSRKRAGDLNHFAQCFLFLYKLCHNPSFHQIRVLFGLSSSNLASRTFYFQLIHQFLNNCNIPMVIYINDVNEEEVEKLLRSAYIRTPLYFKNLVKDFEDPSGRCRTPVILNIDGTYFDIEGSADIELQKYMYYAPRAGHVAKWITFTDLSPKFVALLPIASSQTPSSGDGLLLTKHIQLEDSENTGLYVRSILRGNDNFFVILVCDAGFVAKVPNSPNQARGPDVVTLSEVCQQEN